MSHFDSRRPGAPALHLAAGSGRTACAPADRSTSCSECNLRGICLPSGSKAQDDTRTRLAYVGRRIKRDDFLCRMGWRFESLHIVRSGFFLSRTASEDGRQQVIAFHVPGDVIGVDAIAGEAYASDVVALEDSHVCVIPAADMSEPGVRQHVAKMMSNELVRARCAMLWIGTLDAEERLAAFLVGFSERLFALGNARDDFRLRMTRLEIGSYLGLSLETICRMLARLREAGLISVDQRRIRILDMQGLRSMACMAGDQKQAPRRAALGS
jgi:CRP/FNR family transcriptional regulator